MKDMGMALGNLDCPDMVTFCKHTGCRSAKQLGLVGQDLRAEVENAISLGTLSWHAGSNSELHHAAQLIVACAVMQPQFHGLAEHNVEWATPAEETRHSCWDMTLRPSKRVPHQEQH